MHFSYLISYRYEKPSQNPSVSEFKNGKAKNTVTETNGICKLASSPPRVSAVVKDSMGGKITVDLYHPIKVELSKIGMRITENRVERICNYLILNHTPFEMVLDEHSRWEFVSFDIRKIIDRRDS